MSVMLTIGYANIKAAFFCTAVSQVKNCLKSVCDVETKDIDDVENKVLLITPELAITIFQK